MVMDSLFSNSSLTHWFRVQGSRQNNYHNTNNTKTDTHKKFISNIIPLPQLMVNDRQASGAKKYLNKRSSRLTNYAGHSLNLNPSMIELNEPDTEPLKEQSNVFYSRCIDDVIAINEPGLQNYQAPKEMEYVQSIPYLKYVTVGGGYLWQIEIKKCKFSRKKNNNY